MGASGDSSMLKKEELRLLGDPGNWGEDISDSGVRFELVDGNSSQKSTKDRVGELSASDASRDLTSMLTCGEKVEVLGGCGNARSV